MPDPSPLILGTIERKSGPVTVGIDHHRGKPFVRITTPGGTVGLQPAELAAVSAALRAAATALTPPPASRTGRAVRSPPREREGAYGPRRSGFDDLPLLAASAEPFDDGAGVD